MLNKKPAGKKKDTEQENGEIYNSMQQGTPNILVSVRVRFLTKKEQEIDSRSLLHILDKYTIL